MNQNRLLYRLAVLALAGSLAAGAGVRAAAQNVAEGEYLARAGDCIACHTASGGAPFAGGAVIQTPFGKMLGPNITPDKATGIGNMTAGQFVKAVKFGIGHVGRLYPAMPYIYFNKVPADQLLAIRDYLDSLPPVHNKVHANQLPFPYNIRLLMRGWNLLYFPDKGDFRPDPAQSAIWNRGAYLVQGLGHCAACHTPKTALGGDKTGQELQGTVQQGWNMPNLTSAWDGLGGWSAADIAQYLKTGFNRYAYASGPMAEVVRNSTSNLTDADIGAIAAYLKSLKGQPGPPPPPVPASDPMMVQGGRIYADECAACHTYDGTGQPGIFPSLVNNPAVVAPRPETLLRVVLRGAQGGATASSPTAPAMPSFSGALDDRQVAAVLTYIRNNWGNSAPALQAKQVAAARRGFSAP